MYVNMRTMDLTQHMTYTQRATRAPVSYFAHDRLTEDGKQALYRGLEKLRDEKGAFLAASGPDYHACWMRDQLYANLAYFYLGENDKFVQGLQVVFDMLHNARGKIEHAVCHPPKNVHDYIHAKYAHDTLAEMTNDWGHHQVDAIGLFLYVVGFAEQHGVSVLKRIEDQEMIQILVQYLTSVRYWEYPDNGMWEEWMELHTSSIGAAVRGLELVKERQLAIVPQSLIEEGRAALYTILPNETPMRDQDLAQLSLLWPYDMVPREIEDIILYRITTRLVQPMGVNRYLDDNYYRSDNGVSAEWTFGFFWLALVYAKRGANAQAKMWFARGMNTMTPEGDLPELYQNGKPNPNTPLAWTHALALIAAKELQYLS
jgi:GH15 family glucan-1,4-alpha-glucosidase